MKTDYLRLRKFHPTDVIDCVLTSNFDEHYLDVYPNVRKRDILKLSANYPLEDYSKIKIKIKKHFGIKTGIVFGSGSEELIIRLNDIAKLNHYRVVLVTPLFYRVRETFHGKTICVKEEGLFNEDFSKYDVVWLQNPNLFSGNCYTNEMIIGLLRKFPKTQFFIDEAGIFTLLNWEKYSMLSQCHKYNNLVVLSTFSKIYGLAGLRIGFASGSKRLLSELEENNLTFPLSSFAEYYLSSVLDHEDLMKNFKLKIADHKKQLINLLKLDSNIIIRDSLTNCLFFKHKNKKINDWLIKLGILCLNLDDYTDSLDKGYVRMTVHSSDKIHHKVMIRLKKLITNV